jgi:hypothetical protein
VHVAENLKKVTFLLKREESTVRWYEMGTFSFVFMKKKGGEYCGLLTKAAYPIGEAYHNGSTENSFTRL